MTLRALSALALAATLCAGSALAQTRHQTPAPRAGATTPPVGSVPGQGQTSSQTPVNGIGGQGGGRYSLPGGRGASNSETETPVGPGAQTGSTPGGGGEPVAAEAIINTTRSNIKKPNSVAGPLVEGSGATPMPAPVSPR